MNEHRKMIQFLANFPIKLLKLKLFESKFELFERALNFSEQKKGLITIIFSPALSFVRLTCQQ